MSDPSTLQVAVRVRPLVNSETERGCRHILDIFPDVNQLHVKPSDKHFSYNFIFDDSTSNEDLYNQCVKNMIPKLFAGYNVTILAYGQTGSGKTHTMGTSYNENEEKGVIPRAVTDIFNYTKDHFTYDYNISVSFMELYQEVLYDLLSSKPRDQSALEIREDLRGINIPGLKEIPVQSSSDVFEWLIKGSSGRAVASTNMNTQSSRSHAIFSINIFMQHKNNKEETKSSKFYLVDLAGSERPKKTGACGNTFKEGVNINKGLMVLGNVISILGSDRAENRFVPYRDSNLTRLLKDSLGGNSITLMIACVSPADYNLEETVSTLRYADRAKKIKNKPIVNQDPNTVKINELKLTIKNLQLQLIGQASVTNNMTDYDKILKENQELRKKLSESAKVISSCLNEKAIFLDQNLKLQTVHEKIANCIADVHAKYDATLTHLERAVRDRDWEMGDRCLSDFVDIKRKYEEISDEFQRTKCDLIEDDSNRSIQNESFEGTKSIEDIDMEEKFTQRQMELNDEFQEVLKKLAIKEKLAQKIVKNNEIIIDYDVMAQNEARIIALEKEKAELMDQLKNVTVSIQPTPKLDIAKKRVHDLENQIASLKKKLAEHNHLVKLKEKDEQRVRQLQHEILQMKQNKVRLVRSMKQEGEKFRAWKLERERELAKLKQEDLKKKNQIKKMESMHLKQQQVLKRKVEEAVAINKRLKDALALRKATQQNKPVGKVNKIGSWIKQELDVHLALTEIEVSLDGLLEDRALMQSQLNELMAQDSADEEKIKTIREDIDLRSVQIADMQQKKLEADEDNKIKLKLEQIQSLAEAREALRILLNEAVELKKKECALAMKNMEMVGSDVLETQLKQKDREWSKKLHDIEVRHSTILESMQGEYEEKIKILLSQIRGIEEKSVSANLSISKMQQFKLEEQDKEIERLKKELSLLLLEKEELLNQLKLLRKPSIPESKILNEIPLDQKQNTATPPKRLKFSPEKEEDFKTPDMRKVSPKKKKTLKTEMELGYMTPQNENSESEFEDDPTRDPDWKKTPLFRRITEDKKNSRLTTNLNDADKGKNFSMKRSVSGGCTCSTNCKGRCGCRRSNVSCSDRCRCTSDLCLNRI